MIQRTAARHWIVIRSVWVLSVPLALTMSSLAAADTATKQPRLRAAALQFGITAVSNSKTPSLTGTRVGEVFGALNTTIMLFDDGATRLCLITTHFGGTTPVNVSELFRQTIARDLKIPKSHVLILTSHNHCSVSFAGNGVPAYHTITKDVPPAPLPTRERLIAELKEIDDFIQRANAGDKNTLSCVGLNFPRALSPVYRARLVAPLRAWTVWALGLREAGRADSVLRYLEMEIAVIRIGDVGIVGMSCEPFQGIGRQIRRGSPLPISIPCGYTNVSHGYITDSANTGDREYMSSFYRYSKFRPPFRKPAGDVLAEQAVKILSRFARETSHRK